MDTEYLREFILLAEVRSYQNVADELCVSTSALSRHIKTLETELGADLFIRTTRCVELSQYGAEFLAYAKSAILAYDEGRKKITQLTKVHPDALIVGANYRITKIINEFSAKNKDIQVNVIEIFNDADKPNSIQEMVSDGRVNIGIVKSDEPPGDGFESFLYLKDRFAAVLPASHRLSKRKKINIQELKKEKWIMLPEASSDYELALSLCHSAGFAPNVVLHNSTGSSIANYVGMGLGVSLLWKRAITQTPQSSVVVVDIEPTVSHSVYLCFKKDRRLAECEKLFCDFVKAKSARMR